jgi:hypothetical protein
MVGLISGLAGIFSVGWLMLADPETLADRVISMMLYAGLVLCFIGAGFVIVAMIRLWLFRQGGE